MKKRGRSVIEPCPWMRNLLNRMVDGSLGGPLLWYAKRHTDRCPHCRPAYKALLALRTGLKNVAREELVTNLLSEDRWARIREACEGSPAPD